LIVGQVAIYLVQLPQILQPEQGMPRIIELLENLQLVPERVLNGEVWRLVTFLFYPPVTNPIFAFFFWYLFYFMGNTLESNWGTFRYNLYLAVGYFATVAAAFLAPEFPANNGFLYGTVFLAFAYLYPDFTFYIFFLLPVKVKWLALLAWIGYGWAFIEGPWSNRFSVLAAVLNFLLFFGVDIWQRMRYAHRRHKHQFKTRAGKTKVTHECRVCGISSAMAPKTAFRYCSQCAGQQCYCPDHIRSHEHVLAVGSRQ
jgi:hypothetical protein